VYIHLYKGISKKISERISEGVTVVESEKNL